MRKELDTAYIQMRVLKRITEQADKAFYRGSEQDWRALDKIHVKLEMEIYRTVVTECALNRLAEAA